MVSVRDRIPLLLARKSCLSSVFLKTVIDCCEFVLALELVRDRIPLLPADVIDCCELVLVLELVRDSNAVLPSDDVSQDSGKGFPCFSICKLLL
jgi:hypothetical protein